MEKFQEMYEGITIAKHYDGKTLKNCFGKCYHISSNTEIEIFEPNHEIIKQKLLLDLKVIQGIAEITENNLKLEGITTISQLENHYRYGKQAKNFIKHVENKNAVKVYEQLSSRFTSSNPLLLANSAFFNLSDIIFIDIETLGLGDTPLF